MVKKLVVLGKEVQLPVTITEAEVHDRANLLSLLRDLDPDSANLLNAETNYEVRIEEQGGTAVVYRTGAVFG